MPAALIPSPSRGLWHIGPLPIRGYALCVVLAIIVWLWVTGLRYRGIGGRGGLILDIATLAVPFGLIGARAYGVLTNYHLYFGHHRDWADVLQPVGRPFGLPGGVAAGAAGAWHGLPPERRGAEPGGGRGGAGTGVRRRDSVPGATGSASRCMAARPTVRGR